MPLKKHIASWNEKLAVSVTVLVGTMAFFYLCNLLVMIPLLIPAALPTVQFISSGWLQLILLPVLLIGQKVMSSRQQREADERLAIQEKRATEDHSHLVEIHQMFHDRMAKSDVMAKELFAKLAKLTGEEPPLELGPQDPSTVDLRELHVGGVDRFTTS